MPWQQHVLDVALEYDPITGLLVYRYVGLSVPRQSGKSTLILIVILLRCIGAFGEGQRALYTAQDLLSAREKWEEDHVAALDASPEFARGKHYRVRLSNGSEKVTFFNNSIWRISATTDTAGHGKVLDLAVVDEAFSHNDFRIDQSFDAPMITRPQPQLWTVSTAGTDRSVYLNARRTAGRIAVESDVTEGEAWFEWSAPESADTMDEEVWQECMPALGHTIDIVAVRSAISKMVNGGDEDGARRAYLNLTTSANGSAGFDLQLWARGVDPDSHIVNGKGVAFIGIGTTPDRGESSIAIAGRRAGGGIHIDHVKTAPGTDWVAGAIDEMMANYGELICGVACDGGSPASSIGSGMDRTGPAIDKTVLTARQYGQACGAMVDGLASGQLKHRGQPELAAALDRAKTRQLGDLWLWRRADKEFSVTAIEAATVALGGLSTVDNDDSEESAVLKRGGIFEW